jgi:hypothetical protein
MDKHNSKSPDAEKAKNYTAEMEAAIVAASPLNLESAKALAETMGKSYRSIIAKAKSLGLDYVSKPAPAKREAPETKAQLVAKIEMATGAEESSLTGLEKAPVRALLNLLELFADSVEDEATEA